jgi:phosphoglycerate dehydrogenase-like enzyme
VVRVAILDDYQDVALKMAEWDRLPDAQIEVFRDHVEDLDAVAERLAPFEVVVAMRERTPFPRALLERLPGLRLLVTTGMQNAALDVAAARDCGVTVCGTGGAREATAELTWALILALMREIPREDRAVREGSWQVSLGRGLHGKTLGVLGLGNLGSQVARVGGAFGMEVLAWSEHLTTERAAEFGARLVAKDELLEASDVVTIHLKLSERTRGLIGSRELGLMRPSAYLVNTSRGPIVDEAALIEALQEGVIAGAGLDTFDVEPLPATHPLRRLPNTVLTPHLGYVTEETYRRFYGDAVEDVAAFLRGEPVRVLEPDAAPTR